MKRFKIALAQARSAVEGMRRDEKGVVMVEWVALAGVFVAVLMLTFTLIGDKADVVISEVDTQLGTVTAQLGGGGTGTAPPPPP